jgi:hypothetical protein
MIRILAIIGLAAALVGCGNTGDVTSNDVKSKEQEIEQSTARLNGGKVPAQGQSQGD